MQISLSVLSDDERHQVHERTLAVLEQHGMRVDSAEGRRILARAGAIVDEGTRMVRYPAKLVEECLAQARGRAAITLGGRRPGWGHPLGAGEFTLLADGGATSTYDAAAGAQRPCTHDDWTAAVTLLDAFDEVGMYWCPTEYPTDYEQPAGFVRYLRDTFSTFTKHVQDSFGEPRLASWLTAALEIVFGGRDDVAARHPFSFLVTPASPLTIEQHFTDSWLALRGWDIPVGIMPMPLQGATAPGSRLGTLLAANCETIGTLCLLQAAEPGTPVLYAPVIATMDPRSGRYAAGAVEHAVLAVAGCEMARFYGLPVEASAFCTQHCVPDIQTAWEKAHGGLLVTLAWPDVLVGPGLLGGAMILSLEQLVFDVEVSRIARQAREGIPVRDTLWLDQVLTSVGPCGSFLSERSTRTNARGGEWYVSGFGMHDGFDAWRESGSPTSMEYARERVREVLGTHTPQPLTDDQAAAFDELERRARA
jgi:trimethylamine--corrinoid protein Co-methyltransferase